MSQPGSTLSNVTITQNATDRELLLRLDNTASRPPNDNKRNRVDDLATVVDREVSSSASTSGTVLPSYQTSDLPSYKSKSNFGMHDSAASPSGDGTTPARKPNTSFGMHDSAASLSEDGTAPATAGSGTSKGKGKQQPLTADAVHSPPRTIEDFTKTSRSGEEAAYKLDQAKGFNEWRPLNPGIDAGRDLLSTSYAPYEYGHFLRHLRTPTPVKESFATSSVFGGLPGLESSKYATSTQSLTRHNSVSSDMMFAIDMSRPNSVKPSGREALSQKVPYHIRRARAEFKEAIIERQIRQNKMREDGRKEAPLFIFSRTPSPLPSPPADSMAGSPKRPWSPPSPKEQGAGSSTMIFAPQPISPATHRKSLITEGLERARNEQNEVEDVFAILPLSAMSRIVSAQPSAFSTLSASTIPPAANITPAVSTPSVVTATEDGRGGVRRKKKNMTVKIAEDTESSLVKGVQALTIS